MSPAIRLRHIDRFRDRHGHWRYYLRLPGRKRVALPDDPGSPAFLAAYQREIAKAEAEAPAAAARNAPDSLDALAASYYASAAYAGLRASTARNYRRIIEHLRAKHGTKPVTMLDAEGVRVLLAEKAATPWAANHRLRLIRALLGHAVELGWLAEDPAAKVRRYKTRSAGFRPWSEADIAAFEARWPAGSQERLALYLLLYTGQRRSDVVRMGRQHLVPGGIEVRQVKTEKRLVIPLHPTLQAELHRQPRDKLTFLLTAYGRAFASGGAFYNWFAEKAREAGLDKGLSPHGLRKACGRRMAEAGCSAHQIMSVLGITLQVAAIYTRDADQQRLAAQAMENVVRLHGSQPSPNPARKRRKT